MQKFESIVKIIACFVVIITLPLLLLKVTPILENLNNRITQVAEGAAPMGKEAVKKGIDSIKHVDAKGIGNKLSDAIKKRIK